MAVRPTIRDVAARAGVSVATVSRVLNGKGGVGDQLRQQVLMLAGQMGYQPSAAARRLAGGRSDELGFLVRYHRVRHDQDPFYSSILYAAEAVASRRGFHVVPLLVGETPLDQLEREIAGGRFAGLLAAGPEVPHLLLQRVQASQLPLVLIDNHPQDPVDCPAITSDDVEGAWMVVEHLLSHGCEHLACLTGPLTWPSSRRRYAGYMVALQAHQATGVARVISMGETTIASGYEAFVQLWQTSGVVGGRRELPQAIFCVNDAMALGASRAAREYGLRLPEDLAVAGFDDVPMAAEARPGLTTVHVHTEQIGAVAAEYLLGQIESGPRGTRRHPGGHVVVPVELVVRASCGCPAVESDEMTESPQAKEVKAER